MAAPGHAAGRLRADAAIPAIPAGAAYSGTPLARKLGIGVRARVALQGAPAELMQWLAPLPEGVVFDALRSQATDVGLLFGTQRSALHRGLVDGRQALRPDAALWVCWPKKVFKEVTDITDITDITEDTVRELALPLGWVDVKVCAVSAVWSGLTLVLRKALRQPAPA